MEMVESTFGDEMAEKMIEDNDLESNGIYITMPINRKKQRKKFEISKVESIAIL